MRNTLVTTLATFAVCFLTPAAVHAEDPYRALGPHLHGHGTLNVAVEDKSVSMEFEAPGMDIVGFEQQANSEEEKSQVERAKAQLSKPLELFKVPAAAGCSVEGVKMAIEAPPPVKAEAHDHEDDHPDHNIANDGDQHEGLSVFRAAYELTCTDPARLTSIAFGYFDTFAGARSLSVSFATPEAQGKYQVSRNKPELDLDGIM